ncbi:MAG: hypothetical protein ACKO23_06000, partial [Gemmataceae bacterium]
MATFLRQLYEVMGCFSTATQTGICRDLQARVNSKGKDNLARFFAEALKENEPFSQTETPFLPTTREKSEGRNPVVDVMMKSSPLRFTTPSGKSHEFTILEREIMHLRVKSKKEQNQTAWIDYVAVGEAGPILGEIKWKTDKNPFYALIQLLTYLSEIATPHQVERAIRHQLFGKDISAITKFDLHILLGNFDFNERSKRVPLIQRTHELARTFKARLNSDYPKAAACLGNVYCLAARVEDGCDLFSDFRCLW